ncbi:MULTISPECIES: hypothetical protein [Clostridium]|uniref:hypothetical protein n=1 Tax=Clostridium TaxID=1485 RepID=UPI0005FBFC18|nr:MULTISPECIES: hypothetical protein [Clostridium]KJZ87131.1 hypothetical protein ClosIBUN125C_CONTIG36g01987 [Clostridium sp. IBUN125C]KJZ91170.1 hypothetical protein ClosIBUN62F_CONTIG73g02581 [Clostridium sp. IBUN62F]KJZ94224.1 hypothetical protein ClosIBUN22A_CONTIG144g02983 [Clostridium sp. IBUN22A]KJZ97326.1 Two-component system DNA-binding response regulator [Clostridium sp. IBUN13A]MDM8131984.1 hypothetical protein [Clostridium butyricum]
MNIKQKIKDCEFKPLLLDFIKWKIIDIRRNKKYGIKPHLFGVYCVTGMYGCGKTVSMTKIALDYRKKYGDQIYICSNFGLSIQDFQFTDIKQTCTQYDKPVLFFWDEVQNDFPATEKNFPKEVRKALTLNRKGNGKMFYWASQDHELVHKTIRRLTIQYGLVKTIGKRYTRLRWYLECDYYRLFDENNFDKKRKIHPIRTLKFIQTDYLRGLYNSYGWDNGEKLDIT